MAGVLDGKRAAVTGGSRGIGAAIVRRFLDEGARVVVGSRSLPPAAGEAGCDSMLVDDNAQGQCECQIDSCFVTDNRAGDGVEGNDGNGGNGGNQDGGRFNSIDAGGWLPSNGGNGTAGTSRSSKSTSISFCRSACFSICTRPSAASILAVSVAPSPQRAARKMPAAPMVAEITLNAVPVNSPNRNPPVTDRVTRMPSRRATMP